MSQDPLGLGIGSLGFGYSYSWWMKSCSSWAQAEIHKQTSVKNRIEGGTSKKKLQTCRAVFFRQRIVRKNTPNFLILVSGNVNHLRCLSVGLPCFFKWNKSSHHPGSVENECVSNIFSFYLGAIFHWTVTMGEKGTLPKTNTASKNGGLPIRNLLFQGSIFRSYVGFRDGTRIVFGKLR